MNKFFKGDSKSTKKQLNEITRAVQDMEVELNKEIELLSKRQS